MSTTNILALRKLWFWYLIAVFNTHTLKHIQSLYKCIIYLLSFECTLETNEWARNRQVNLPKTVAMQQKTPKKKL